MKNNILLVVAFLLFSQTMSLLMSSCAQIGAPTGGPKDTLAPVLIKAIPDSHPTRFAGNKITLTFNEYIELQDLQSNILVSPAPKTNPLISSSLKTISIKLKDTLEPNTTYSIDFGNAIKDINEGNVLQNFSYVFSTGDYFDSLELKGKVVMAETGKIDSTLLVLLYRNAPDSAVCSRKPNYVARLKGDGSFVFKQLPADAFQIYVLKDGDGNKFYNAATEVFGFLNQPVRTSDSTAPIELLAYAEKKQNNNPAPAPKKEKEKRIRYTQQLVNGKQDILSPMEILFNTPIKAINNNSFSLTDTNHIAIKDYSITVDSSRKKLTLQHNWEPGMIYHFILNKEQLEDSTGLTLLKNDTLRFATKTQSEYGSLKLTFKNLRFEEHPILCFMDGNNIKSQYALTAAEWQINSTLPGDYEIRILYDVNNNGVWDPGNYTTKKQPERTQFISEKITIKADWDNERTIDLP